MMKDVGDQLDPADKTAIEADIQALKDVLAKSTPDTVSEADIAELKAAKDKLMESAQKLAEKVYAQAQAAGAQGAGPDMGGAQAGPDAAGPEGYGADDVVDGEYKEV